MTPNTLKLITAVHPLSSAEWALVLGCTVRAFNKWRAGDNPISGPTLAFFRLLELLPLETRRAAVRTLLQQRKAQDAPRDPKAKNHPTRRARKRAGGKGPAKSKAVRDVRRRVVSKR